MVDLACPQMRLIIGGVTGGFGKYVLVRLKEFKLIGTAIGIPIFITVLGFLVIAVEFFGCCSASKLSRGLLITFAMIVGIIILAEIVGAVLLIVFKDKVKEGVNNYFSNAMKQIQSVQNKELEEIIIKPQAAVSDIQITVVFSSTVVELVHRRIGRTRL
ncbi:hypothetical protein ACTXT7_012509 [Hymenolepis weldensis]